MINHKTFLNVIAVGTVGILTLSLSYIIITDTTLTEPRSLQCNLNTVVSPDDDVGCVTGETALALALIDGWDVPEGYEEEALKRSDADAFFVAEQGGCPKCPGYEITTHAKRDAAATYVWVEHTYHQCGGNRPWNDAGQTKLDYFNAKGVDLAAELIYFAPWIRGVCDACDCRDGTVLFLIKMPEDGRIPHFISHKHS